MQEESKEKSRKFPFKKLIIAIVIIILAGGISFLAAWFLFPAYHMYGSSMYPAIHQDEYVVCVKTGSVRQGDIIAFEYNNKVLIRRVIAVSGDVVDIREDGSVYVNDSKLEEPYIRVFSVGNYTDVNFPCEVPDGCIFVLGDNRIEAVDSRNSSMGFIEKSRIIGKLFLRIWPLSAFGGIK